jgi:hypothetical protein
MEPAPGIRITDIKNPTNCLVYDYASQEYIDYGEMRIMRGELVYMETNVGRRLVSYLGLIEQLHEGKMQWFIFWRSQDDNFPSGKYDVLGFTKVRLNGR